MTLHEINRESTKYTARLLVENGWRCSGDEIIWPSGAISRPSINAKGGEYFHLGPIRVHLGGKLHDELVAASREAEAAGGLREAS